MSPGLSAPTPSVELQKRVASFFQNERVVNERLSSFLAQARTVEARSPSREEEAAAARFYRDLLGALVEMVDHPKG